MFIRTLKIWSTPAGTYMKIEACQEPQDFTGRRRHQKVINTRFLLTGYCINGVKIKISLSIYRT